jgi:SAM-dependent methyltransferase
MKSIQVRAIEQYHNNTLKMKEESRKKMITFTALGLLAAFGAGILSFLAPCVLDVACGTGALLSLLHELLPSAELSGIDGSQDMLALAYQRLAGVPHLRLEHIMVGPDAQAALPFPAERFDLITCTNALHALPDPVATLTALHRLLAPGGHLLLADFVWRPPSFSWGILTRLARRAGAGSLHPHTLTQARTLCEQAGLSVAHTHAFVIDRLLSGWVISHVKQ